MLDGSWLLFAISATICSELEAFKRSLFKFAPSVSLGCLFARKIPPAFPGAELGYSPSMPDRLRLLLTSTGERVVSEQCAVQLARRYARSM